MDIEKHYTAICISVAALLAIGVWFYGACRNDVSDIRRGADETRSELESAREEQRDQAAALDRAENSNRDAQQSIRESQQSAGRIEERNTEIQDIERSDAEIVRESQSIIAAVRARGRPQGTGEG